MVRYIEKERFREYVLHEENISGESEDFVPILEAKRWNWGYGKVWLQVKGNGSLRVRVAGEIEISGPEEEYTDEGSYLLDITSLAPGLMRLIIEAKGTYSFEYVFLYLGY